MRNVHAVNNSINMPMRRLQDGGGLYTNVPCYNCNVSRNVFESDGVKYGCLYHDGGSEVSKPGASRTPLLVSVG